MAQAQAETPTFAATTGGSRTFSSAVVTWTPSTTASQVTVTVTIGGNEVAYLQFDNTNLQLPFQSSGTGYSTDGLFAVSFGPGGSTGVLYSLSWKWSVNGQDFKYTGVIGNW
jgi:hypothetical protein